MSIFGKSNTRGNMSPLSIKELPSKPPEFPREYSVQVTPEVHMTITTIDYGLWGRSIQGELRQQDGKTVWFEPGRPADKILDPILLPHVKRWCKDIMQIDREAFTIKPMVFIDKNNTTWWRK